MHMLSKVGHLQTFEKFPADLLLFLKGILTKLTPSGKNGNDITANLLPIFTRIVQQNKSLVEKVLPKSSMRT